jgi:hypothetical protein
MRSFLLVFKAFPCLAGCLAGSKQVVECTVKARVMPGCFLILLRTFLRLDGDSGWLRETRFAHVFGTGKLMRDVQLREVTGVGMASAMGMLGPPRAVGMPSGLSGSMASPSTGLPVGIAAATASAVVAPVSAHAVAETAGLPAEATASGEVAVMSSSPFAPKGHPSTRAVAYDAEAVRMATKAAEQTTEDCSIPA